MLFVFDIYCVVAVDLEQVWRCDFVDVKSTLRSERIKEGSCYENECFVKKKYLNHCMLDIVVHVLKGQFE